MFPKLFTNILIYGFALYLGIGLLNRILYFIALGIFKLSKFLNRNNNKWSNKHSLTEYRLEDIFEKYNIFLLRSNLKKRLSNRKTIRFSFYYGLLFGLVILLLGLSVGLSIVGNPFDEFRLFKYGTTTNGFIIDAWDEGTDDDRGKTHFDYYYTYSFQTSNGQNITSQGSGPGMVPNELRNLNQPYSTEIVYLKDHPEISKLRKELSDSIWDVVLRKVFLGSLLLLVFMIPGIIITRKQLKDYHRKNNDE